MQQKLNWNPNSVTPVHYSLSPLTPQNGGTSVISTDEVCAQDQLPRPPQFKLRELCKQEPGLTSTSDWILFTLADNEGVRGNSPYRLYKPHLYSSQRKDRSSFKKSNYNKYTFNEKQLLFTSEASPITLLYIFFWSGPSSIERTDSAAMSPCVESPVICWAA